MGSPVVRTEVTPSDRLGPLPEYAAALAFAGFKLGQRYAHINDLIGPLSNAILAALVIGYIYRVWTHRDVDPHEGEADLTSL